MLAADKLALADLTSCELWPFTAVGNYSSEPKKAGICTCKLFQCVSQKQVRAWTDRSLNSL